jgi:hypothetical protein
MQQRIKLHSKKIPINLQPHSFPRNPRTTTIGHRSMENNDQQLPPQKQTSQPIIAAHSETQRIDIEQGNSPDTQGRQLVELKKILKQVKLVNSSLTIK